MLIGDLRVDAVSDGTFVGRPEYFGPDLAAGARPDFFSRHGAAWLPIGCFVIRGAAGPAPRRCHHLPGPAR